MLGAYTHAESESTIEIMRIQDLRVYIGTLRWVYGVAIPVSRRMMHAMDILPARRVAPVVNDSYRLGMCSSRRLVYKISESSFCEELSQCSVVVLRRDENISLRVDEAVGGPLIGLLRARVERCICLCLSYGKFLIPSTFVESQRFFKPSAVLHIDLYPGSNTGPSFKPEGSAIVRVFNRSWDWSKRLERLLQPHRLANYKQERV